MANTAAPLDVNSLVRDYEQCYGTPSIQDAVNSIISVVGYETEIITALATAIQFVANLAEDLRGLTVDEAIAVNLYTIESPFYKEMNKALRNFTTSNEFIPFLQFLALFSNGVNKCPQHRLTAFNRGMSNMTDSSISLYQNNGVIYWPYPTSISSSVAAASAFIGSGPGHSVKFIIIDNHKLARDIQHFSAIAQEYELIILPGYYEITDRMLTFDNVLEVWIYTLEAAPATDKPSTNDSAPAIAPAPAMAPATAMAPTTAMEPATTMAPTTTMAPATAMEPATAMAPTTTMAPATTMAPTTAMEPATTMVVIEPLSTLATSATEPYALATSATESNTSAHAKASKTCVFQNVFDKNGVLFHIATKGLTQPYRNPHEAGYVVASRSTDGMFGGGDVKSFVGRTSEINATGDKVNSWMCVDLGAHRSLIVNHFVLRYGWSCTYIGIHFPQNFELQGSNDNVNWEMIQRCENDTFNNAIACPAPGNFGPNQPLAHWPVTPDKLMAFRYFRILQFAKHQGDRNVLALSGFELYGDLVETI